MIKRLDPGPGGKKFALDLAPAALRELLDRAIEEGRGKPMFHEQEQGELFTDKEPKQ